MNQFTAPAGQSEAFMQNIYANGGPNLMNMPPEMQTMTAQQLSIQQQQLMSQQPQVSIHIQLLDPNNTLTYL